MTLQGYTNVRERVETVEGSISRRQEIRDGVLTRQLNQRAVRYAWSGCFDLL